MRSLLLFLFVVVTASGCASVKPWVKPYERQKLADPIMKFDMHPISAKHEAHVFESREAARGADGSGGGGCGCN